MKLENIEKVLKKILLWLFDSGNNEVFAKAINDIENEIIQKNKVMKANAPEKIWIDLATDLPKLSGHIDKDSVEYIKKDAFIEKACVWIKENITNNPNATKVIGRKGCVTMGMLIKDFKKAMEE